MKSPFFSRERVLGVLALLLIPVSIYATLTTISVWWALVCSIYLTASCLAFAYYAFDKHAAIHDLQRIPEKRMHLIELVGGWPGAWLAQRVLRHKTIKKSFRRIFWLIVICHVLLWGYLTYQFFM